MIDSTQKLIVRQCAFKGAIELLPEHFKYDGEAGPSALELIGAVEYLTDKFEKIILK